MFLYSKKTFLLFCMIMYVTYTCIRVRFKYYICNDMHEYTCVYMCICVYSPA